jgi:hypothetical protein
VIGACASRLRRVIGASTCDGCLADYNAASRPSRAAMEKQVTPREVATDESCALFSCFLMNDLMLDNSTFSDLRTLFAGRL